MPAFGTRESTHELLMVTMAHAAGAVWSPAPTGRLLRLMGQLVMMGAHMGRVGFVMLEVLVAIVVTNAVQVMHDLCRQQEPTESLLDDEAMREHAAYFVRVRMVGSQHVDIAAAGAVRAGRQLLMTARDLVALLERADGSVSRGEGHPMILQPLRTS